ncbi:MAG: hypothetical protein EOO01_44705 [Chitinophagaceae bacterium]|nr:MAG: hypothetical protein EOO01_44705 [Chitinophagaceae bacterium]
MMQVIIAPDKFKGSLTSFQVCDAIRTAFTLAGTTAELYSFPMADGGDGFAAIMKHYLQTQTVYCKTIDPIGRAITAGYEWNENEKTAIIEMAVASGLVLLQEEERNQGLQMYERVKLETDAKLLEWNAGAEARARAQNARAIWENVVDIEIKLKRRN